MMKLFKKLFGTAQGRIVKKHSKFVDIINEYELQYQMLSDDDLRLKTEQFKKRVQNGESLEHLLPEAYAVVKNACRRMLGTKIEVSSYHQEWDMVPYDVQLIGAIAMFHNSIAEMKTGEGKTLTASLPLYLNALSGKPVHLVTVNDYLAKRDCEWVGSIFRWLGLTTGSLTNDTPLEERKKVYECDIVYGTASEFGFDYLRDHSMIQSEEQLVQRGHFFAIIDEVDSILIDEARTPLIISGPVDHSNQMYDDLKKGVNILVKKQIALCNVWATQARKTLQELGLVNEEGANQELSKKQKKLKEEALLDLWKVFKGMPRHKILKKIQENPDIRSEIENIDVQLYSEQSKQQKQDLLSELFLLIDERANEYELTDKGIQEWKEASIDDLKDDDFTMLDLGEGYANIDALDISDDDKMQKKLELQQEDLKRKERYHNIKQLLRAYLLMEKDIDYIIQDNKIIIIDEHTGRAQPGRRFSDGLHQSIEAKEGVSIQEETQTYATVTLQNYFRLYEKLAGMSGTAMTEGRELNEIYKLNVVVIPTYKPSTRVDYNDEIYMTEREKYHAILKEIKELHAQGRPILIGTESVEISEKLSRIFKTNNLPHTILNARHHEKEAEVIAQAGQKGSITISTNMAGRGTDIKLGEGVANLGGLHVLGTTRHHSRRIDRQLRGRSARLGDPGSTKFYASFEDSLIRMFASPKMTQLIQRFRPPEGEAITSPILTRSIETAQKRIEQRNFTIRKHTLEYDDVMNTQRKEVYQYRLELLKASNLMTYAEEVITHVIEHLGAELNPFDPKLFAEHLMEQFPITFETQAFAKIKQDAEKQALEILHQSFLKKIEHQNEKLTEHHALMENLSNAGLITTQLDKANIDGMVQQILRTLFVSSIDKQWQEHLLHIDHLREEVGMRAIGQKDPLMEFKHESFTLFDRFINRLRQIIAKSLFKFEINTPNIQEIQQRLAHLQMEKERSFVDAPTENKTIKIEPAQESPKKPNRNDPCPCDSGKKYKKCCGSIANTIHQN